MAHSSHPCIATLLLTCDVLTVITEVTWAGTGCPPGSVSADIGEEATLVSLSFSKYVAATGTGQSASDARKNCDVRITLHYPQGWSWTVATTDMRGYARIPTGCSGRLGATYFFSGSQNDVRVPRDHNDLVNRNKANPNRKGPCYAHSQWTQR